MTVVPTNFDESDKMSWEDVIKQKDDSAQEFDAVETVREYDRQFRIQAKQLLKELAEIHHKLDELESEGAINYQPVDKVEDAMTALRQEIKEMRQ